MEHTMRRVSALDTEVFSDRQKEIYDQILASRGNIAGPFCIWLHSPEMADRAQQLGEFARYMTVLGPRLSELAILVVSRFWDCQVEWSIHEPFALKGGLGQEVIDAIRDRQKPVFEQTDEAAVYDFVMELLQERFVQDRTFKLAVEHIGEQGAVELTGLIGYYTLVAMTLNAFQAPLPEGMEALLTDCPTF